jgi:nicotinate-nucleotide adenylyltransferase
MNLPARRGRKVAFFGGSFDPPHLGHLAVARAAQEALGLDTVLFAPVGLQPLKPHGSSASFADRVAMTELAIKQEPKFALSLADAPSAGTHNYTIDTLHHLREELGTGTELYCLMGADSFANLKSWHRGAEIPFAAPLIVAARPGEDIGDLTRLLPEGLNFEGHCRESWASDGIPLKTCTIKNGLGSGALLFVLPGLHVDISASEIRRQVQAAGRGEQPDRALQNAVREYIATHRLYH